MTAKKSKLVALLSVSTITLGIFAAVITKSRST